MFYGNYAFEIRINEKKILMQMKPCDRYQKFKHQKAEPNDPALVIA